MATFTDNELRSFLEKIPLFSSIPYNQLRWLSKLFEPVSVKKGDVICKKGDPDRLDFITVTKTSRIPKTCYWELLVLSQ